MGGVDLVAVEEIKIEEEGKKWKRRNMEKYAPLIFEECYVKNKFVTKIVNSFEV